MGYGNGADRLCPARSGRLTAKAAGNSVHNDGMLGNKEDRATAHSRFGDTAPIMGFILPQSVQNGQAKIARPPACAKPASADEGRSAKAGRAKVAPCGYQTRAMRVVAPCSVQERNERYITYPTSPALARPAHRDTAPTTRMFLI